jgi:NAD(P)-dependent dehydrogenase (short-subunit alcohol dehydrogenase family)
MPTTLITGANRGLGLGLAESYAADGWRVIACARDPQKAAALQKLEKSSAGRVSLHALDVEDHGSIDRLAGELKKQPIDLLLNVAGWFGTRIITEPGGSGAFGESRFDEWERMFRINVIGVMKMSEAFADHVAGSAQKKIVALSSILASIANNTNGGVFGYRATKAALNAVMHGMAADLKPRGITVLALNPGWVRTDMGGPTAPLDTAQSVRGMRQVIDGLTPADSGTFKNHTGATLPW